MSCASCRVVPCRDTSCHVVSRRVVPCRVGLDLQYLRNVLFPKDRLNIINLVSPINLITGRVPRGSWGFPVGGGVEVLPGVYFFRLFGICLNSMDNTFYFLGTEFCHMKISSHAASLVLKIDNSTYVLTSAMSLKLKTCQKHLIAMPPFSLIID